MPTTTILEDLYRYNDWANDRIFALCRSLTDAQLDEPREMGFGSLRNTLFHILAAEEIWFERWNGDPWRPFQANADGLPIVDIATRLHQVSERRQEMFERKRTGGWRRIVQYKDGKGREFNVVLGDLALHVANHGIHHRAQALSFLKSFGQTVPGGLDYIFYRFARPFIKQESSAVEALRQWGLDVETGSGDAVSWDGDVIQDYFAYGDWSNDRVLSLAITLDDATLDRSWSIGMDSIRKTALHIADAERWWIRHWTVGPSEFERAPESTSLSQLREEWQRLIEQRNSFIGGVDAHSAQRVITAMTPGPTLRVPLIESFVQLCGHGTHHRAQLINMLRHSGVTVPPVDLGLWVRERTVVGV